MRVSMSLSPLILGDAGWTLFPRIQLVFNHDYLPVRVAPISGLLSSFCSQLHFQSLFFVHVGNFGFTSFPTGETCQI
jgi:hypothetical protein